MPATGNVIVPAHFAGDEFPGEALVAAVSSLGHLLTFWAEELPELGRGKGNKVINIPTAKFKSGDEHMVCAAVFLEEDSLEVFSGQRRMVIKPDDLEYYFGERGQRGKLLPRGWRKVDRIARLAPDQAS